MSEKSTGKPEFQRSLLCDHFQTGRFNGQFRRWVIASRRLSLDALNFDSISEDELGYVDNHIEVDEVSSSSDEMISSDSEEMNQGEEEEDDRRGWGTRKSNYYGGIEDVRSVLGAFNR